MAKKPSLLSPIANKTIEAKGSESNLVIGAAKRIRESDRYETFGTPEKGYEQPSKDIDFGKQMKIDQKDS